MISASNLWASKRRGKKKPHTPFEVALDLVAVQVNDHHDLRGQILKTDAARLHDGIVGLGIPAADVPAGHSNQPVPGQFFVHIAYGLLEFFQQLHRHRLQLALGVSVGSRRVAVE